MPIVINIRSEAERALACAFCDEPIQDDVYGIACDDCAQQVFASCEACCEPVFIQPSVALESGATFAFRVSRAHPRYRVFANSESMFSPSGHAPRSFLPRAFGLCGFPRMRIRTEDDPYSISCSHCVNDCPSCGAPFFDVDNAEACCAERWICEECSESYESEEESDACCGGRILRSYSYSPVLRFWSIGARGADSFPRADASVLYMGMELELEKALSGCEAFLERAGEYPDEAPRFLWTKSDGSLSSSGVELVTMPSTLEAFRKRFPFGALEQWREDGARSYEHESCGLHIHVARSAFDAPHLWRFARVQLWNPQLCQLVAQRDESHYAQWSESGRVEENRYGSLPDFIKGKDSNRNRYVALNFQNGATVELRYFKGNITKDSILTKLSFVDSLYRFTKQLSYRDCASGALRSPESYLSWMRSEDYPELRSFLTKRGLL